MQNDPLAELRDIHLPQAIGWWPPAIGWWIVAGLLLAALLYAYSKWRKVHADNTYRRQAVSELDQAWKQFCKDGNMQAYVKLGNIVLRRAALHRDADNRRSIAPLAGQEWFDYLDSCCNKPIFAPELASDTLESHYKPVNAAVADDDVKKLTKQFHNAAMKWIKTHP